MVNRAELLNILADQNRSLDLARSSIPRHDLDRVANYAGKSALILKGVRRCGKSTILKQFMNLKFSKPFYVNFEDERLVDFRVEDFQKVVECLTELFGSQSVFFFDEIQNIKYWEKFVHRLLEMGNRVYLTGSNSELLSKELGTHMTGRHVDFEIFPFSFQEFLAFKNFSIAGNSKYLTEKRSELSAFFKEYLEKGGMPEPVISGSLDVFGSIVEDIVQKDIIKRYNLRKAEELNKIVLFLISNVSKMISFKSIAGNFGVSSPSTAERYVSYLEDTYLIFTVRKFERKLKQFDKNPKKIYCIDNGIVSKKSVKLAGHSGALLENLVAVQLRKSGFRQFYYINKNGTETDFVLVDSNDLEKKVLHAIQVCVDPEDILTRGREEKALLATLNAENLEKGSIITLDFEQEVEINGKKISYVPAWKWLLETNWKY